MDHTMSLTSLSAKEENADDDKAEPFDPLAAERTSDQPKFVSLRLRGKMLQRLQQDFQRRGSRLMSARRISNGAESVMRRANTQMRLVIDQTNDELGDLLEQALHGNDADTDFDTNELMVMAVVALWRHHRMAAGLRRWREMTYAMREAFWLGKDINLNAEARKVLISAETTRQAALDEAAEATTTKTSLALSPRTTESLSAVRLSRDELDLLSVWARQMQSKTFRSVDDTALREVMRFLRFRHYQDGESLFYEGETGQTFFIAFQGTVAVFVGMNAQLKNQILPRHQDNLRLNLDTNQLGKRVFTYRSGDSFGETAMFSADAIRTASAVAVGPCEICELHRDVYRRTLRKYHKQFFEQAQKLNFLQRVKLFHDWPRLRLTAITDFLEKRRLHFGDVLITERATTLNACYLVLSGVLKLTQWTTPTNCKRKRPSGHPQQLKVELMTVVANEIVALEALLNPRERAQYTATAATANVEVYVLKEVDARSFIGVLQSALYQQVRQICGHEAAVRNERLEHVRKAMMNQDAATRDLMLADPTTDVVDSLDEMALTPESPRHKPPMPLGLMPVPPSQISEGAAPYLPHLRGSHLFADAGNASLSSPRAHYRELGPSLGAPWQDISVVSSPKMLSTCARKFLFEHSDTLAQDYSERLSQQFPPPRLPESLLDARRNQLLIKAHRLLENQVNKLYESKMHWDPKIQDFVVVPVKEQVSSREQPQAPRPQVHSIDVTTPRTSRLEGSDQTETSREPITARRTSARRPTDLHRQLRATQQTARQLVDDHLKRMSVQQNTLKASSDGAKNASFLHFFADS
ncbi:hypothetical protein Poli38472_003918 [Pythium oligandrum]|uniref:Cyclic nucleotide-binding domain-containing protein n=1 Tax=Pythium oligandrum TaxID=41045 RepID=A0A8K1CNI4_PYTOL|nr:hypothetical protein Poli38472_003918 [Pythium oligandrum]|eukprot:TMW66153.1 hypothetical protein Poli38472_003918 [Pythium oligandrum]